MKLDYRLALLGLIAALTACLQAPTPDTTPPTIASSVPSMAATGVAVSANLSIRFSEGMDKASLRLVATPTTNLGPPAWSDSSTVVYSLPGGWAFGTAYSISVEGKDVAGNALAATSISFQTVAALDTTPPATPSGITATLGDGAFTLQWAANTESDLGGYTVYWGEAANALVNASFIAKPTTTAIIDALENAKTYFYAVDAEDSSGNRSAKSAPQSVTPADTTPPTLTSSEPANGTVDISLVPNLSFTFSEPMTTASLEVKTCATTEPPATATCDSPSLGTAQGGLGTPIWSENDTRVQFSPPTDRFASGKTHVILLSARDIAGNPLPANTRIAFATRSTPDTTPPTVTGTGFFVDSIVSSATITYFFSEPMQQSTVQNAFLSQPPLTCSWAWSRNTATCTVRSGLIQNTSYTLTLGTLAADTAGNRLSTPDQRVVRTGNLAPRVTAFTPNPVRPGTFFAPTVPIVLTFSEPMETVNQSSGELEIVPLQVTVGRTAIAGTLTWSESSFGANTVLTFTSTTGYGDGARVGWSLAAGRVQDKTGIRLSADVTGSFQTRSVIGP
jgi:Bacterial Ig-like domain